MNKFDKLSKAVARGEPGARILLAELYAYGVETAKNVGQAFSLLEQAASDGEAGAASYLALLYVEGLWGRKDSGKAKHWMKRAALAGDPNGLQEMARSVEKSATTSEERRQALEYYKRAVAAGSPFAALRLHMAYSFGDLDEVDEEKAAYYLELGNQLTDKLGEKLKQLKMEEDKE